MRISCKTLLILFFFFVLTSFDTQQIVCKTLINTPLIAAGFQSFLWIPVPFQWNPPAKNFRVLIFWYLEWCPEWTRTEWHWHAWHGLCTFPNMVINANIAKIAKSEENRDDVQCSWGVISESRVDAQIWKFHCFYWEMAEHVTTLELYIWVTAYALLYCGSTNLLDCQNFFIPHFLGIIPMWFHI